jgi:feruloyl esterase
MPVRGWTGRFEGVGNGNYAGMLSAGALPYGIIRGSAIATTDTGHESTPADPRAAHWAGSREQLIDFGHRAVHLTASVAKKIVSAFYGTPARHSYFVSCSNGGRQGLMSALRYPEDFEGIVAGAPARSWTRLNSTFMSHHKRYVSDPETRLPEQKVQLLTKATTAACDAVDGVLDGIVDDPRTCTFDAAMLRCDGDESENCLTAKQLETVRLLRAGTSVPRVSPVCRLARRATPGPPGFSAARRRSLATSTSASHSSGTSCTETPTGHLPRSTSSATARPQNANSRPSSTRTIRT